MRTDLRERIAARHLAFVVMAWVAAGYAAAEVRGEDVQQEALPAVADGPIEPFLGAPRFDMQPLFVGQRFPNVVVATDGTVLATWGRDRYQVRRSEDGGATWGPAITVADPGFHGGGALVDEQSGDVLVFVEDQHPPSQLTVYRSSDHGKNWNTHEVVIHADDQGNVPSMHMSETGITLRHGPHSGRLLRPARVYERPRGYNTAIFSDDGGSTWHSSGSFPDRGTGEGGVVELSDGRLYYSSRKHFFEDGTPFSHQRLFALSLDGGLSWQDLGAHRTLPDGPRYRGEEARGANYNGHFGMMAGLVRLPVKHRDILLYSNADTPSHERISLTVWASFDGGGTWPVRRLVFAGPSAYSSLAAGRPGTPSEGWIYLQFEGGPDGVYSAGQLARFNLAWLLQGERTGDGTIPEWLTDEP
jgi:hypothetical protein